MAQLPNIDHDRSLSSQIIEIDSELRNEAVELISLAFENYPVPRYYFSDSEDNYLQQLRNLFGICYDWRQALGWTIKGVVNEERLVAVACISEPEAEEDQNSIADAHQVMLASLGEDAVSRIEKYEQVKTQHLPKQPHFYLNVLGVHPNAQGKGYGRVLLDWLHQRSQLHPTSSGVGLDTQNSTNVSIYKRFGYYVTATAQLENNLPIWCMFQNNSNR